MFDTAPRRAGRVVVPWLIAVVFQALLVVVSLTHPAWFGYSDRVRPFGDVRIYLLHAAPILEGGLPYRDYPVEYPVLALPIFIAPFIAGTGFESYRVAFVIEMLLFNALGLWLVAKQVEESEGAERVAGRLAWYSAFFAALSPMIVVRFDLVPMLLAFAAARWFARGRMILGGLASGLGVMVKLVPGLVFLPFLANAGAWRPKVRGLLTLGLTVTLGFLGWWSLAGDRLALTLRYHGERGLEIGSLYSSAFLVAHKLAGVFVITHFDHGSMNLFASGARDAASLSTILQGALLILVASRSREAGPGHEFRYATAAIVVYLIAGKVLSPQYLIWLMPFVCVLGGTAGTVARRLFLPICVLTTLLFPWLFRSLIQLETLPVLVLVVRNLTLIVLFAVLIGPRSVTPTRSSPEACS